MNNKMKIAGNRIRGFTLLEIMIVVALIGMLAAIAIPNLVKARSQSQANACLNNLRQVDNATQEWALEHGKGPSSVVLYSDIQPYLKSEVLCPAAGSGTTFALSYSVSTVSNKPSCQIVPSKHICPADTIN
jgi:prepilin-type N-terminal cleavage/methylation domain-containing protein